MPPETKAQKQKAANEKRAKTIAAKKAAAEDSPSVESENELSGPSKKRKRAASTPASNPSKNNDKAKIQYVYIVIWQEYGGWRPTETKYCGAFTSIKDANNKIIDLWSEVPDNNYFDGSHGVG